MITGNSLFYVYFFFELNSEPYLHNSIQAEYQLMKLNRPKPTQFINKMASTNVKISLGGF